VATKNEIHKRRVQAQRQADTVAKATTRRERRRRLVVGGVAGTLAVAMVASIGVGFLTDGTNSDDDLAGELDDTPLPVQLVTPAPGAAITGETPCPATDGTQQRTTTFENPPPVCIAAETDPSAGLHSYQVSLVTDEGEIVVMVDATDLVAANLFVTNAWYGVYDDVPFWLVIEDGLAITGDTGTGNPGFTVPATPAARPYAVGDVIMWADQTDGIGSQFAFITSDEIVVALNSAERAHPIVGSITPASAAVLDSIIAVAGTPGGTGPRADIRIVDVAVSDVAS
jgi:cyclophilin family peptidyl-prolyl cis-trans isomerase